MPVKPSICVGELYQTNKFGFVEVLEYHTTKKIKIRFINTNNTTWCVGYALKTGAVRDLEAPSVYGKGMLGNSSRCLNIKTDAPYKCWQGMMNRCYSPAYQEIAKTYHPCTVSSSWLYFPTFRKWYEDNNVLGWELDKDMLVQGNTMYSEDCCTFLPKELNNLAKNLKSASKASRGLTTGVRYREDMPKHPYEVRLTRFNKCETVGYYPSLSAASASYKKEKEAYIKVVAEIYYDKGLIADSLYIALLNWKVIN